VDLIKRVEVLRSWPAQGVPGVLWLGGLFEPVIFISALLRQEAQRQNASIDAFEFCFDAVEDSPGIEAPEAGAYIRGLRLEGASWDSEKGCLADPKPMQLAVAMPLVHFRPVLKKRGEGKASGAGLITLGVYPCTVYDSRPWEEAFREEPLMQIQLKMPDAPDPGHVVAHWVRRMAAVALATPH
jgi:dynein heavy chain, axonemal